MKNSKNKTSILTGSLIAGAIGLTSITAGASNLFNYNSLGSGSELRSELLNANVSPLKVAELECGDKKKTGDKSKTGEAKCGDKKKDSKGKSGEGKCGEGKCGDKKATTPAK
jgi:uncharacterized low-complexity protein